MSQTKETFFHNSAIFEVNTRPAYERAEHYARSSGYDYIGTGHVLLGILDSEDDKDPAAQIFRELYFDTKILRNKLEKVLIRDSAAHYSGQLVLTRPISKAIEFALQEARMLGHNYLGTNHLLLGFIRAGGVACEIMEISENTMRGVLNYLNDRQITLDSRL